MREQLKKKHKLCRNALFTVGEDGVDYWAGRSRQATPSTLLSPTALNIEVLTAKNTLDSFLQTRKRNISQSLIPVRPPAKHVQGVFMDVGYDFTEPAVEHYGIQIELHFVMGGASPRLYTWRVEAPSEGTHNYWHVQSNADPSGSRRMDTETGGRFPCSYPAFPLDAKTAFEALTCSLVAMLGLNGELIRRLREAEKQSKNDPGALHPFYLDPDRTGGI